MNCEACAALRGPQKPKVLCERCQIVGAEVEGCTGCADLRAKKPKPVEPDRYLDDDGVVVPVRLVPVFKMVKAYKKFELQLTVLGTIAKEIEESPAREGKPLDASKPYQRFYKVFKEARQRMKDLRPSIVCGGNEACEGCDKCRQKGWLTFEERQAQIGAKA